MEIVADQQNDSAMVQKILDFKEEVDTVSREVYISLVCCVYQSVKA